MDIQEFIARLARELGVKYSTYWKWFDRGHVPFRWRDEIRALAWDKGRPLGKSDMVGLIPRECNAKPTKRPRLDGR